MVSVSEQAMRNAFLRTIGVLVGLTGVGLLIGAFIATVGGGMSLVSSSGYILVVFVAALALLMACGGLRLAFSGNTHGSLVPPWAMVVAGALMVLAIVALLAVGPRAGKYPNAAGTLTLAALGVHWLRSGIRGSSANKPLEPTR
jgi:hypothetical protein